MFGRLVPCLSSPPPPFLTLPPQPPIRPVHSYVHRRVCFVFEAEKRRQNATPRDYTSRPSSGGGGVERSCEDTVFCPWGGRKAGSVRAVRCGPSVATCGFRLGKLCKTARTREVDSQQGRGGVGGGEGARVGGMGNGGKEGVGGVLRGSGRCSKNHLPHLHKAELLQQTMVLSSSVWDMGCECGCGWWCVVCSRCVCVRVDGSIVPVLVFAFFSLCLPICFACWMDL